MTMKTNPNNEAFEKAKLHVKMADAALKWAARNEHGAAMAIHHLHTAIKSIEHLKAPNEKS